MLRRRFASALLLALLTAALVACSASGMHGAQLAVPAARQPAQRTPPAAVRQRTLTVFAAASLTESFNDLGRQFESVHPGVTLRLNYAGSQQLSAQLAQGASADVFASANNKEMWTAIDAGAVISGTQQTFARNRLIVIFPKDNPARMNTLADLAKPGLKLDLADKSVPVGQYSQDVLAKLSKDPAYGTDFQNQVLENVVSYETDVKAVVTKVSLGEVDAGLVYTTDASAAADRLGSLTIPDQFNQIATYPIAPLAEAPQPDLAEQFVAFVLSAAGQQTLAHYGFMPGRPTGQQAPAVLGE